MVYAFFALGTAVFSSIILVSRVVFKSKLKNIDCLVKFKDSKYYKYIYLALMILTFIGILVILVVFKEKSEPIYLKRDHCCEKKIEDFQRDILKTLDTAKTTLSLDMNIPLHRFHTSIEASIDKPLLEIGDVIYKSIDISNFTDQNNVYDTLFTGSSRKASDFETMMGRVRNSQNIKPECADKINKQQDLFNIKAPLNQIREESHSYPNNKIPHFKSQLGNIQLYYENVTDISLKKIVLSTTYVSTNFGSFKDRISQSLIRVNESKSIPLEKSDDMNWVDMSYYLLYTSGIFMLACSIFPISVFVSSFVEKKHPTLPSKIYLAGLVFVFVAFIIICVSFCALSWSGALQSCDICSQKAKKSLLSKYSIQFMNGESKIVEKNYDSACKTSNETFFSNLEVRNVLSTEIAIQMLDYEAYKNKMITSISDKILKPITFSKQFKESMTKLSELVVTLKDLLDTNCFEASDKNTVEDYRDKYNNIVENGPNYQKLVENFGKEIINSKEAAITFFDECFKPIQSDYENLLKKILEKIELADFSCQPLVDSDDTCSKQAEIDHIGLFFCILFIVCFLSVCVHSLPNPWISDKKDTNSKPPPNDQQKPKPDNIKSATSEEMLRKTIIEKESERKTEPEKKNIKTNVSSNAEALSPAPKIADVTSTGTVKTDERTKDIKTGAENEVKKGTPNTPSNANENANITDTGASNRPPTVKTDELKKDNNIETGAGNEVKKGTPNTPSNANENANITKTQNGSSNGGAASSVPVTSNASTHTSNARSTPNGKDGAEQQQKSSENSIQKIILDDRNPDIAFILENVKLNDNEDDQKFNFCATTIEKLLSKYCVNSKMQTKNDINSWKHMGRRMDNMRKEGFDIRSNTKAAQERRKRRDVEPSKVTKYFQQKSRRRAAEADEQRLKI